MTTTSFVVKNGITVGNASITASSGNANVGNLGFGTGQITGTGNITTTGNVSAGYVLGNGSQLTGITAASATTAGTVTTAAQPNITSVGTLTSLTSGNITATSFYVHSVGTAISAAGATQGTATAITKDFNVVSTVISGANGVALPTALAGYRITVFNTSANALNVYPLGNGIINSAAANVAFSLPAGDRLDFLCTAAATAPGGQWYTLNATYG